MTHAQYAAAIIETALNNGLTIEEIIAKGPEAIAEAHLHCQLKATAAAAEEARQILMSPQNQPPPTMTPSSNSVCFLAWVRITFDILHAMP